MVQPSSNVEWPLRMSSQEALLASHSGNGSQLLLESATGSSQLLQQQLPPPPPEPWTSQQQPKFVPAGPNHMLGGTLGRHTSIMVGGQPSGAPSVPNVQYPTGSTFRGGNRYPLYHTCERPTNKKRVTIVEDNNTESSV